MNHSVFNGKTSKDYILFKCKVSAQNYVLLFSGVMKHNLLKCLSSFVLLTVFAVFWNCSTQIWKKECLYVDSKLDFLLPFIRWLYWNLSIRGLLCQVTMKAGSEPPAIWKVQKALLQKFVPELRDGKRVFSATNSVSESRHTSTHVGVVVFTYMWHVVFLCSILDILVMQRPCTRGCMWSSWTR